MMDNEEIKRMFSGFKENIGELKVQLKEIIDDSKEDHKEIRKGISGLCDRMTSTEKTLDNHLINSAKKEKSKREKISYVIAVAGMVIAAIALYVKL